MTGVQTCALPIYEDIFHLLFEATVAQSIYQKQLPLELQEREYLQAWLKDTAIPRILARLRNAKAVACNTFDTGESYRFRVFRAGAVQLRRNLVTPNELR